MKILAQASNKNEADVRRPKRAAASYERKGSDNSREQAVKPSTN